MNIQFNQSLSNANKCSIITANFQVHEITWGYRKLGALLHLCYLHVPHTPVNNRSVCGTATATKGVPRTAVRVTVRQLKWSPLTILPQKRTSYIIYRNTWLSYQWRFQELSLRPFSRCDYHTTRTIQFNGLSFKLWVFNEWATYWIC
jgi:hypothetical protein